MLINPSFQICLFAPPLLPSCLLRPSSSTFFDHRSSLLILYHTISVIVLPLRLSKRPRPQSDDEAHNVNFETAHAGSSLTFPMQCSALRKSGHVNIKGRPCKVCIHTMIDSREPGGLSRVVEAGWA